MKKTILLSVLIIYLSGCGQSWKATLSSTGDFDAIVNNCITDFSHTKMHKKFQVFEISKMIYDSIPPGYLGIRITPICGDNKIFAYPQDTIGLKKGARIPTRFLEVEGKLYCWDDSTAEITEELFNVYNHYGILDQTWIYEMCGISKESSDAYILQNLNIPPPYTIYERLPIAIYFINKLDYTKYTRNIPKHLDLNL